MTRIRTRFAPSPTGPLHIGGVRTALYAYLFAKKHQGDFILRIEDTDTPRTVLGSEDTINESLAWCDIIPDEGVNQGGPYGPYRQSERKEIYLQYALELIKNGKAYYAFDTDEDMAKWREQTAAANNGISLAYNYSTRGQMNNSLSMNDDQVHAILQTNLPYVIRLKVEETDHIEFHDLIRGDVRFQSAQIDDRVLIKSDGMPTYHLANIVDDHLMEITHVIRGEEWLASTPTHILLYRGLGWTPPQFAHLPLFLKPDGKGKLSKRDGDKLGFPVFCTQFKNHETGEITSGFREKGFQPDAFVNFIAMLGWNDGTEKEIFSMEELIAHFSLERVHKAGAKFNYEKAIWFNQQYIKTLPTKTLVASCLPIIQNRNPQIDDAFVCQYCELFRERIDFLYQLPDVGYYMYSDIREYDIDTLKKKWKPEFESFFQSYIDSLGVVNINDTTALETHTKSMIEKDGLGLGNILPILRIALTGTMKGPSIFDTISLIGLEQTMQRIQKIAYLLNS